MKPIPLAAAAALAALAAVRRRRVTRLDLVVGTILFAGLVLYGTGAIHPPKIKETIADVGAALGPYTYLLVGVAAFLETGAFIGLIAPGETIVLVGGVVAGQGEIEIGWLIGIVWVCAVAGDTVSFYLGRRLGRQFLVRHGPKVKITPQRLRQVERFFGEHGGKTILIGRFVGLVRAVAPFIAGASGMRYRRFAPYDVIGAGLWGSTFCVLGYVFWQSFDKVAEYAGKGAFALGTVIAVVAGGIAARRWLSDPQNRARARSWLHVQAQRPLLRPLARVVRPIVFSALMPAWRRARRPAQFTWRRFVPGDLGLELTALVAVAAVSVYAFAALAVTLNTATPFAPGDLRAFVIVRELRMQMLTDVARALSDLGALPVAAVTAGLAALAALSRRRLIEAVVLALGLGLTALAVHLVKAAEDRPRPSGPLVDTAYASFPSGHSAYAVAYVAAAVVLMRSVSSPAVRFGVVIGSVVLALAVAATRVYLRAHYLSDVVGGLALGAAVFSLCGIGGLVVARIRQHARP